MALHRNIKAAFQTEQEIILNIDYQMAAGKFRRLFSFYPQLCRDESEELTPRESYNLFQ